MVDNTFTIDTLKKSEDFRKSMKLIHQRWISSKEVLNDLLELYPELRNCTHEYVADELGVSRETITRTGLLARPGLKRRRTDK